MDVSRCNRMTDIGKMALADGIAAVTAANMWGYLADPSTSTSGRFMNSNDVNLVAIFREMKYETHDGFSFAQTIRQLEYIAKRGFDAYVEMTNGVPNMPVRRPPTPMPRPISPIHNRANTGGASIEPEPSEFFRQDMLEIGW